MKKDFAIIGGLFFVIAVLLFFGQGFTTTGFVNTNRGSATSSGSINSNSTTIRAKTMEITATVADKPDERKKGLSKMDSLPIGSGMIFVFDNTGKYGIWMKGMKFAIDIIWINEDKKIVDIVRNAPPQPGKDDDELTIYNPKENAKYILEVNAGLSNLHDLQVGDEVNF